MSIITIKEKKIPARKIILHITLLLFCLSCNSSRNENPDRSKQALELETSFDNTKWRVKVGPDYPYRDQMLNDIVYNDTIRSLSKNEILKLLGEPDRRKDGYLYYIIAQKRLGSWTLNQKTMVIYFSNDSTITWIKIHE